MDAHSQDPWTEAQWTRVQETVRDEAKKARVAAVASGRANPAPVRGLSGRGRLASRRRSCLLKALLPMMRRRRRSSDFELFRRG